jgi:hypothetical protein
MAGSERQHVLNVNLQLFVSTVRGCGALQIGAEGITTTTTITSTRCTYVVTTSNSSGLEDFSGSLMC